MAEEEIKKTKEVQKRIRTPRAKVIPEIKNEHISISKEQRTQICEELIKLKLRGISGPECAKILGFHYNTLSNWMKKPEFQLRLAKTRHEVFGGPANVPYQRPRQLMEAADRKAAEYVEDVDKLLEGYSVEGVKKIHDVMKDSKDERLQFHAARDLADRGQKTSRVKKIQSSNLHAILTPEMLASMATTAREIQLTGHAVDALENPLDLDPDLIELIAEDE